jgi:hypothetical protein
LLAYKFVDCYIRFSCYDSNYYKISFKILYTKNDDELIVLNIIRNIFNWKFPTFTQLRYQSVYFPNITSYFGIVRNQSESIINKNIS